MTGFTLISVDGQPGWRLPYPLGHLPSGRTCHVVAVDPKGRTRLIERGRINRGTQEAPRAP